MNGVPPKSEIRDGDLKASIWENEGKKGKYFTTTFAKTYRDQNDQLRDTSVFNNNDLLKVSELARQAYGRTNELRQELKQEQSPDIRKEQAKQRLQQQREARERNRDRER